jgi:hypothetical protein
MSSVKLIMGNEGESSTATEWMFEGDLTLEIKISHRRLFRPKVWVKRLEIGCMPLIRE